MPKSRQVERLEIAGPGFINFFLHRCALTGVVKDVLRLGEKYGHLFQGAGNNVTVEFVSANPTGPLHVGHGRGAAYGASLAGILDIAGEAVISIDACQKIILFNKQAEDTFGYTAHEGIGQPLDMLLPERFWDVHRDHIAVFADSDDVSRDMGDRQELYGRRKSGEEFVIEASISKLSVEQEQYYYSGMRPSLSLPAIRIVFAVIL